MEVEAMSPRDSMFFAPGFELSVIAIIGGKTKIDVEAIKRGLQKTLLQHPRFTSIVIKNDEKGENLSWKQTKVNLDNHVIVPKLDPSMDSPDLFVDNYISNLTQTHFTDLSKPLWEFHLLDVKTSHATSTGVFKIHHSLGDGASLISLLLACTRKSSDPTALPTIRKIKARTISSKKDGLIKQFFFTIWSMIMLILNTIVDMALFIATIFFLKDTKTYLKGGKGVEKNPKRFVHRTICLDDMKLVKKAMNVTINDVALGMTQAALSRYLARKYEKEETNKAMKNSGRKFLSRVRLRAAITFNIRPTTGIEIAGYLGHQVMYNTTFLMSNVVGPQEEISFFGHPVAYIAPSIFGFPQALTVHLQGYVDKMAIVLAADQSVIPDADKLCDDFVEAFELIKTAALGN